MKSTRWLGFALSVMVLVAGHQFGRAARPTDSEGKVTESAWPQDHGSVAGHRSAEAAAPLQPAVSGRDDQQPDVDSNETWSPVATFSILGFDPETGEVGGAVQSKVFCVGNGVLWGEAEVGMVATQAYIDVSYGPQCLKLLREGRSPDTIVEQVLRDDPDPSPEVWPKSARQFAVMTAVGDYYAFTGEKATPWAGHAGGKYVTAQGNILAGEQVVKAMVQTFEKTEGHLSLRLMAALEAGQKAGGDKRGMQSAAMLIVKKGGGVWLNNDVVMRLQVDDHENPIKELRRLVEKANQQLRFGGRRASKR